MPTPRLRVVVTTYDRPDGLARLVDDLEREGLAGPDVHVYDDATPRPDAALDRRLADLGCVVRRAPRNHGKRDWWRWWNVILADLEALDRADPVEHLLCLQDDVRLCRGLADRAAATFAGIDDPARAALHLHVTAERSAPGSTCWTGVPAQQYGDVVRTGWVDMGAFWAHRRLFAALGWRLEPVPETRWTRHEERGSGVGEQLSLRAHAAGLGLYQVPRSLVVHDASPSLMNAAARARWPLRTLDFVDGADEARRLAATRPAVLASLASVPEREEGLRQVVERLRPQVDRLLVHLNGYSTVPAWLVGAGVEVATSPDRGVPGDAGKFHLAGAHTGVHLTCDDDLAYPPDYAEGMLAALDRYHRAAVVGVHASTLRTPFTDYARSRTITHLSRAVDADAPAHILGTGTVAYHSSTLAVRRADFPVPNMADVWFALLGQRQRVPFVQVRRPAGWLRELTRADGTAYDGLYRRTRRAEPETAAVLAHGRWELFPLPGTAPRPARRGVPERPPAKLVRVPVQGPEHRAVLMLPRHDHITEAVRATGTYYERDLLDAVRERARGGVFVDVGAHHGNHTAYFALECDAARVVAVEPDAAAVAGLRETVAANGLGDRVDIHQVALHPTWRHASPVPLALAHRPGTGVITNTGGRRFAEAAIGVPACPLDALPLTGDLTLVKVDAGGIAGPILASGRRTLQRHRPYVVAAVGSDAEAAAVRVVLEALGYDAVGRFGWSPTWLWSPGPRRL